MNNEISRNSFLKELHETTEALIKNRISIQEAEARYRRVREKTEFAASEFSSGFVTDMFREICYHHCTENFCKYSGIHFFDDMGNPFSWAGDDQFKNILVNKIVEVGKNSDPGETVSALLFNSSDLSYTLYYQFNPKSPGICFASVSSSPYFQKSAFDSCADIIWHLYSRKKDEQKYTEYNAAEGIENKIRTLINNLSKNESLDIQIYIFQHLEEIFGGQGIDYLADIHSKIKNIFQNEIPDIKYIYQLSFNTYLILAGKQTGLSKTRLYFNIDDITLPYKTVSIDTYDKTYHQLLSEIASYEQYVNYGKN